MSQVPTLSTYSPDELREAKDRLLAALEQDLGAIQNESDWKTVRDKWLARKSGLMNDVTGWLRAAPNDRKRDVGATVNELKAAVESQIESALARTTGPAASSPVPAQKPHVPPPRTPPPPGVEPPTPR